jgi:hypothetical protein
LAAGTSSEEIEAAYRRLARRYPPELNPLRFAQIKDAYEVLTSLERRMRDAESDPARALAALFPAVEVRLAAPPEPLPPLTLADWEPLLAPLRSAALAGVLRAGVGRGEAHEPEENRGDAAQSL